MNDTEILDWIEDQLKRRLGFGDLMVVEQAVCRGAPIREAIKEHLEFVRARGVTEDDIARGVDEHFRKKKAAL